MQFGAQYGLWTGIMDFQDLPGNESFFKVFIDNSIHIFIGH